VKESTVIVALLGLVGTLAAAFIGAWATMRARSKNGPAATQGAINDGFTRLSDAQEARIKKLEDDHRECEARHLVLEGEMRALRQYVRSLVNILRRYGIPFPPNRWVDEPPMIELPAPARENEDSS